ncbi:MAG: MOSC domain-containing protein [Novosphingobium sp.]
MKRLHQGLVVSLSKSASHSFSKQACDTIELIAGVGIRGDVHAGRKVKHLSRVAADPDQPNLRQVHLIPAELHDWLADEGFRLHPSALGENVLTSGLDLQSFPRGTHLRFPSGAELEITGLRNPCAQIEQFMPGLLGKVVWRDREGVVVRRAGIMAIVIAGGEVAVGDTIEAIMPQPPYLPLERV